MRRIGWSENTTFDVRSACAEPDVSRTIEPQVSRTIEPGVSRTVEPQDRTPEPDVTRTQ